jgi:hypothetical protein
MFVFLLHFREIQLFNLCYDGSTTEPCEQCVKALPYGNVQPKIAKTQDGYHTKYLFFEREAAPPFKKVSISLYS